ncbi:MAG: pantetheine-phosphate adenylyltransferase, partial [Planctomycetes bacterium]|nr:pantetheine-phosphate adenylyltransferase [Planctomycetota bacterium]
MKAIYAFSGDPITKGHIDIIERAAATYSNVTVAIGANPNKVRGYLLSIDERLDLARRAVAHLSNVDCVIFEGLLAQYAYRNGYNVIIRGIRNGSDLEAELTLYHVNHLQFATIDTVFLPTKPTLSHVSSSVVKALLREGGDVSEYVPSFVKQKLEQKISGQVRIGIAGGLGSGKSFVAAHLAKKIPNARHIDLDRIGHYILSDSQEPKYLETRNRIARQFGKKLLEKNGAINRKALGAIVFKDPRKLTALNEIMLKPILAHLYEMCRDNHVQEQPGPQRIIFLESGLFVVNHLTHLVNHCMILVTCPEDLKIRRLIQDRKMAEEEARQK